ncbi:hypothetical protein ACLOJK_021475 [Asimina triloba]
MAERIMPKLVDSILDKDNYTLEELLDEDEIIQECKALNGRLINFLRERSQVEQLLRYIVEEAPEDAEKRRTFKFPFIACEIFTCEVDIILKTLVEDEESLLSSAVGHQEIFHQLVDLIGITSIMEVLIRLIGADEHMYSNYLDSMQCLQDSDVLQMIVDKFSSSDSPEVHANAAEILCAITRFAPPGLAAKISSPSFVGRLFCHALDHSRQKSVLVHSLVVCISLLDPKRLTTTPYHSFRGQMNQGPSVTANPETVEAMLGSLGDLLELLDVSLGETVLPTTYGKLQPPLGKHRLKIVEFISVLLTAGSEAAEKELIRLGAIQHILDLFFEYPYNNFLHHHVESIVISCLESKKDALIDHILQDCHLVKRILGAEKNSSLSIDPPTMTAPERSPPKIGNIGHLTHISNKLIQLGSNNSKIQQHLQDGANPVQENSEWLDWHSDVLLKRNAAENVYQWACGRPTSLQDRTGDSDDDDFRDRDYDVAALANNLSQAFRYGIYSNDSIDEAHGSLERDDEDVYFDDESAEVVISSLRLGDDQDSSSLFTNSNWFAFEDDRVVNERSTGSIASSSPSMVETGPLGSNNSDDEVVVGEDDLGNAVVHSKEPDPGSNPKELGSGSSMNSGLEDSKEDTEPSISGEGDKPPEWVEWRETLDSGDRSDVEPPPTTVPNGEPEDAKDRNCSVIDAESSTPNGGDTNAGGKDENTGSSQVGSSHGDQSAAASAGSLEAITSEVEEHDKDGVVVPTSSGNRFGGDRRATPRRLLVEFHQSVSVTVELFVHL